MDSSSSNSIETIQIHRIIPAKRWRVLRALTRLEEFPNIMPNVKECQVIERTKNKAITQWYIELEGLPIRWKQCDHFDKVSYSLHFESMEGDLENFKGKWVLARGLTPESTSVRVEVQANLGIPIFDDVIRKVLHDKLYKNFESMLKALEETLLTERYRRINGRAISSDLKGFVVMGHPYNFKHLMKYFKVFKPNIDKITPEFLMKIFELAPTFKTADIKEYQSKAGVTVNGYFVLCPIIPDMALLSPEIVLPKVIEGCRIAERLGAGVLALGGFTSIVGEKYFDQLKSKIKVPITTGNTFTSAMALEGVKKACRLFNVDLSQTTIAIIGGTGDIGSACARVLAEQVKEIVITGRTPSSLKAIHEQLQKEGGAKISTTLDNNEAAEKADVIIAAASSTTSIVDINRIKPGAIVCDVGYPKNIGHQAKDRPDIFVFGGGLATAPTPFNVGFDVGLPAPDVIYGCFAEAIILSLEGRYENFSEGKGKIMPEKIELIRTLAAKHGFELAPFYRGSERIDESEIEKMMQVKKSA